VTFQNIRLDSDDKQEITYPS